MHVSERARQAYGVFQKNHRHDVNLARRPHAQHGCNSGVEEGAVCELEEEEQLVGRLVIEDGPLLLTTDLAPPVQQRCFSTTKKAETVEPPLKTEDARDPKVVTFTRIKKRTLVKSFASASGHY